MDIRLIIGAVLFGAGWGLSGLCPGTFLSGGFFAYSHAFLFLIGIFLGAIVLGFVDTGLHTAKFPSVIGRKN